MYFFMFLGLVVFAVVCLACGFVSWYDRYISRLEERDRKFLIANPELLDTTPDTHE